MGLEGGGDIQAAFLHNIKLNPFQDREAFNRFIGSRHHPIAPANDRHPIRWLSKPVLLQPQRPTLLGNEKSGERCFCRPPIGCGCLVLALRLPIELRRGGISGFTDACKL